MSKRDFTSIDLSALATVTGGMEVTGEGSVDIGPGTGKVDVKGTYKRSNYESCLATVTSHPNWKPSDVKDVCGLPPSN
ncbi:MAG TPA: hypothetical protein VGG28_19470 [Kofleriaceae bacterium]|jgi:hypothetical protein